MTITNPFPSLRSRRCVLVAAVACSLLLLSCGEGSSAARGGGAAAATAKTDFRLKTLDGRSLGPRDFGGQVVVVDFWATWCLPCRLQAQILEPVYRDYKGRGVQFLAADVGEETETVKKFLQKKPFPYPVILDPEQSVSNDLGVLALPTLMVIDKKGKISYFQSGVADGDTLRQLIKNAGA
ncbi:MAG TPA: TlpA disulfide reductase family protein [Thermoanaerobaculia bacterium]|jgi:thiol-disulfide isomerase/thioredoxin|nr:TlpA disulfide reductase family protein [Thermoanaerobaculia bacterium]